MLTTDVTPWRFGFANVTAALWAAANFQIVHRRLKRDGVRARVLAAPTWLPAKASRGMEAVLRRTSATCLESALIRQEWNAAHGRPIDVIVGVNTENDFRAHAWLATDQARNTRRYAEIHRIPPVERFDKE